MRTWSEVLNSVAFLRDLWKSHKNPIFLRFELPFVSRVRFLFFIPMGNTEFLNFFHFFDFIRSCVQNYFFTPEIGIVKQLKNNEVWCIFMAFSKALKKATELAKSNFTNTLLFLCSAGPSPPAKDLIPHKYHCPMDVPDQVH